VTVMSHTGTKQRQPGLVDALKKFGNRRKERILT
jgi:hypothetical protein